ncbi:MULTISPECIES: alpha/beta fold hydrolase [unclassified Duganella]|uniref:alpha/beta fold hydrolase n=1 Tax=unclassified Duganella TaxID=2636909 RepID=UPI000E351480|nr:MULTISPECIES: alpha/beta hydrolase [unclassified Duganella]RFP14565.1 alpha/beta hydrolase [Duganella sp. BJB475]RFP30913.1 alpha/beta hydrolase [Duganella sp. BJB476]
MKQLFSGKLAAAALMSACVMASAVAAGQDGVNVGSYHVDAASAGSGPYTVIFESGFASDLSVWRKVAPEIAKSAKVFFYSRAGIGKSDARPEPRTPQRSSAELDQLIEAAHLSPPFILVGHSYGGYLIRLFAQRHPEQVAGMVFVDPSMERFDTELKKLDAAKVAQDQKYLDSLTPAPLKAESKLVDEAFTAASLQPAPRLPDVPAVVLTSTMVREQPEFFMHTVPAVAVWRSLHEQLFLQFSSGSHVVTANSGHNIHLEEPALVAGAIQQVIAGATAQDQRRVHKLAQENLLRALDRAVVLLQAQRGSEAGQLVDSALKESRFGENEINGVGYMMLGKRKQPQLAALVMKFNADTFPASANAHDSYGELLLEVKQPLQAKAQFQQAIALGTASEKSPQSMEGYRKNLAKAEQALAR